MPFKSSAQRAWMYANKPKMAAKWQAHTPKGAKLTKHVKKSKSNPTRLHFKLAQGRYQVPNN